MRIHILGIFIAIMAVGGIAAADSDGTVTLGGTVTEVMTLTVTPVSGTTNIPINPLSDANPAGTTTVKAITNLQHWTVQAKWSGSYAYNGCMGAVDGTNFHRLEHPLLIYIGSSLIPYSLPSASGTYLSTYILSADDPTTVSGTSVLLTFVQPGSMNDIVNKADGTDLLYSLPIYFLLSGSF